MTHKIVSYLNQLRYEQNKKIRKNLLKQILSNFNELHKKYGSPRIGLVKCTICNEVRIWALKPNESLNPQQVDFTCCGVKQTQTSVIWYDNREPSEMLKAEFPEDMET